MDKELVLVYQGWGLLTDGSWLLLRVAEGEEMEQGKGRENNNE